MNRSTIIIIAGGFFFALIAAMAVQMLGSKNGNADNATQIQMVDVLVASKDLAIGEELVAGSTSWAPWPQTSLFAGAVTREGTQKAEEALTGRVRRVVSKGEPVIKSALIDDTKSNFVAASLTPGNRAVSLSVNAQTSVAGFVMPEDRVDVVLIYDVRLPGDDKLRKAAETVVTKTAAETILENLRVLATDQETGQKSEAKVGKTVTLEVTPRQAETLILAGKMGTLSLTLRSVGDLSSMHAPIDGKPALTTTDMRVSGVMREIMKGENKSGSLAQVVRVYSGTRVENVEVRPYSQVQ